MTKLTLMTVISMIAGASLLSATTFAANVTPGQIRAEVYELALQRSRLADRVDQEDAMITEYNGEIGFLEDYMNSRRPGNQPKSVTHAEHPLSYTAKAVGAVTAAGTGAKGISWVTLKFAPRVLPQEAVDMIMGLIEKYPLVLRHGLTKVTLPVAAYFAVKHILTVWHNHNVEFNGSTFVDANGQVVQLPGYKYMSADEIDALYEMKLQQLRQLKLERSQDWNNLQTVTTNLEYWSTQDAVANPAR